MQERFNSVLALCKMNIPFLQAPDVSTRKERNLKLNPPVRSALRELYTKSDPTSFQTDLNTTHLVSITIETIASHYCCYTLFGVFSSSSQDRFLKIHIRTELLSILTSLLTPHISHCKPEEKKSVIFRLPYFSLYFKKTDFRLYQVDTALGTHKTKCIYCK